MTLGNYSGRRRRGPPLIQRILVWVFALIVILGAATFAYRQAASIATGQVKELQEKQDRMERELDNLMARNAGLRTALEEEQQRAADLREQYERDVPDAEIQALLEALRERREAGVAAERLTEVIAGALNQWDCETPPETKRFVIQTPVNDGANDQVNFANGTVTLTGTGVSVRSAEGLPEAWFDAAAPVTLTFTRIGGEATDVTGILPLHHSLVFGADIHRFSIVEAEPLSYVDVTNQICAYP